MKRLRLHLGRIEDELRDVQRYFPAINAVLNCRRDDFTDTVRQNMLTAYEFLDAVVDEDLDLFSDEGLEALLQLNHLVLLGRGYDPRAFGRHITVTRRQFFDNFRRYVKPIRRWYRKHETENPYKVASQVYVGVLSQPQLYQEGNHRTGSLIASGILLQNGCPPFVLTRQNAVALLQSVLGDQVHRQAHDSRKAPSAQVPARVPRVSPTKRKPGLCAQAAVIPQTTLAFGRIRQKPTPS